MTEPGGAGPSKADEEREAPAFLPSATSVPSHSPEVIKAPPNLRPGLRPAVVQRRFRPLEPVDGDDMLVKKKPVPPGTKTGNNSIITQAVSTEYAYNCSRCPEESDYITAGITYASGLPDCFQRRNNELIVRSTIVPLRHTVVVEATAFAAFAAPPPQPADIQVKIVIFKRTLPLWNFEKACIAPFLIDNAPNSTAISKTLQGYLRPANSQLIRSSASVIYVGHTVYDNSGMYAKLIYWALVLEHCEQNDIATLPVEFPIEPSVTTYSLNSLNTEDAVFFMGSITTGSIILVDGEDFKHQEDLQVILWLSRSGRRINCARTERAPDMIYLNWPSIQVGLYVWQDNIPLPAAAILPSEDLFSFAFRLATTRVEWDSLNKGIYIAMAMMGTRYTKPPTEIVAERHQGEVGAAEGAPEIALAPQAAEPFIAKGLTTFLSAWEYELPYPQDYNVMFRGLNKRPPYKKHNMDEANRFYSLNSISRINGCALLTALIRAMVSTVMISFNVGTDDLIRWFTNTQPSGTTRAILDQLSKQYMQPGVQPERIDYVFDMIYICTGWTCHADMFAGGRWVGRIGSVPDAESFYRGMVRSHPPRIGSVLCVDNFLHCRPIEWGVLGPNTALDFSADLLQSQSQDRRGYYACLGERKYTDALRSNTPYQFIAYGLQAVNAIHQHFRFRVGMMSHAEGLWSATGIPAWALPLQTLDTVFQPDLHIFEPCTTRSFNPRLSAVMSPTMVGDAMTERMMDTISFWKGKVIQDVGYQLMRKDSDSIMAEHQVTPEGMYFPGRRKRAKHADKESCAASEN